MMRRFLSLSVAIVGLLVLGGCPEDVETDFFMHGDEPFHKRFEKNCKDDDVIYLNYKGNSDTSFILAVQDEAGNVIYNETFVPEFEDRKPVYKKVEIKPDWPQGASTITLRSEQNWEGQVDAYADCEN